MSKVPLKFHGPFGKQSFALLKAISDWTDTLPPGVVEVESDPIPADDDYGLELILTVHPSEPEACPIGLLVTNRATGVTLHRWGQIARKVRVNVKRKHEILIGLGVEPMELSVEEVLQICRQVAAGKVHLEVGVWRGRLVSTWGYVGLPSGRFKMSGCGDHWFWRPASKLGLAEIREVSYAPWS